MIPVTTFAGKTVAVFGLGGSGIATANALITGGATVAAWDDGEAGRTAATKANIPLVDLAAADWSTFAALVLAPGVPLTHPEPHWTVHKAKAANVEIIGDIELFCRERNAHCPDATFIAITGTNGKSTTTSLIAHILHSAGMDVQMGGNIGVPILALEPPAKDRFYVIEMSSFQIDLTPSLNPTVGVLLNITPDHIDRHGTVENYAAIKGRLIVAAKAAVISIDDAFCRAIYDARIRAPQQSLKDGRPSIVQISTRGVVQNGYYAVADKIFEKTPLREGPAANLYYAKALRGRHNMENATAGFAVMRAVGLGASSFDKPPFDTFGGLRHRQERVASFGPVDWINDSKATNAESTETALQTFPQNVYWILGGKPKDGGIEPLRPYFKGIAKAYLIGAASDEFAQTLEGQVPYERCVTLDAAVSRASADALAANLANSVVLLSPACASYDQFRSFEHRGDTFRALVLALPGFTPRGKA